MSSSPPPLPRRPAASAPPPLPPASALPLLRGLGYVPPPVRPLDVGELAALGSLPLRARRLADALGAGGHKSRRKGSSIEFADYRDYQPGDELRRVDWRLYARTDRLHIRETHEETPLRVVLLLDVSPSMAYASRSGLLSKLDYARMLLGAVALLARRQRDAVGLGLVSSELSEWQPPSASPLRRQLLWTLLDRPPAARDTDLPAALHQALDLAPRRCLFVLASDFYDEPERLAPAIRRLRYERHDLLALQLADPAEVDFAFTDPSVFFDLESGTQLTLDPAAAASAYRARFAAHRAALGEQLASQGLEHLFLRTDTLPLDELGAHLSTRSFR